MYALIREALYLVEAGYATCGDVDRSFRNDLGYWATFAGPFRFMDITGIKAYATVMEDLFPDLNCSKDVPELMKRMVESGAEGIRNAKGFYQYTPEEAARWEKLFLKFSYEIRALAAKYPSDIGSIPVETPAEVI
jgi:3-hydroxybutyryl-CoA dehydrogenase